MFRHRSIIVVVLLLSVTAGCRLHRPQRSSCCGIDICKANRAAAALNTTDCCEGLSVSFDGIPAEHRPMWSSLDELHSGPVLRIGLEDCCCVAALNSPVANLIDKERKAICCEKGCVECIDRFLGGQAQTQRNKSAGNAGELLLRLVEVQLQEQLLQQAFAKLDQLFATVDQADQVGMATDQAAAELESREIELKRKLVELDTARLKLTMKLNLILGIDSCDPRPIEPCFELIPQPEDLDANELVIFALMHRPEVSSMKRLGASECNDECLRLISQLDPRLGIGLASPTRCLLPRLRNRSEASRCIRKKQIQELKSSREELIRQEVLDALIAVESGYEKLTLHGEELARLDRRRAVIDAAAELDSQQTYIDAIENWVESQQVRSERISTAIEYEIAKVRLREATGQWICECGLCDER